MVVANTPSWTRIFKQIGPALIFFLLVACVAAFVNTLNHPFQSIAVPDLTITVLGAALGILLGFRTNSAYDRWWEARKLWGRLVNTSRTLARQAITFSGVSETSIPCETNPVALDLVYSQIAFVQALRCALRKQDPWGDISRYLSSGTLEMLKGQSNVPLGILQHMAHRAADAARRGAISDLQLHRIDSTLTELSDIQGGCERIKNTPLPRQYDTYPEMIVNAYCFILPLVLVDRLKYMTPVITLIIAAAFLALNCIGKNLEDPFENTVYDTPMSALSRTIEINLLQMLREEGELPAPVAPSDGVLM